jgi:hypothetical protein
MAELQQGLSSPVPNEGLIARVAFQSDRVILTPSLGSNRDRLNRKIQNEKKFREITASIPGLYHPKILKEDPVTARYEIEKATGLNLTAQRGQVQGGGMVDFFHVPTEYKAEAMLTYLRAVDAVNQAGFCFVDHKSDSVFIDAQRKRVSIVDADALEVQSKGAWERELQGGLQKVLRTFFTRNIGTSDSWTLIPAGPAIVIDGLDQYKSAHDAAKALEGWMKGEKTIHYGGYGTSSPKEHMELLARPLHSGEMDTRIQETDFGHITDYQRDMLEADIYVAQLFRSEEPQSIDKFSLGIRN